MATGPTPSLEGVESYYADGVKNFLRVTESPDDFIGQLSEAHRRFNQKEEPAEEQVRAWRSEVIFLRKFLEEANIPDAYLILEMLVGQTRERADAVICGRDEQSNAQVSLLELKTWHTSRRNSRRYDIHPFHSPRGKGLFINLYTYDQEAIAQVSSSFEVDPREQVLRYRDQLCRVLKGSYPSLDSEKIVHASALLYNCTKLSEKFRQALDYNFQPNVFEQVPIYTRRAENGSRSIGELSELLRARAAKGEGVDVFNKLMAAISKFRTNNGQ